MKQKTKKRLITYTLVVVWLVGCYFIGQSIHSNSATNDSKGTESASVETGIKESAISIINAQQISTDEIPWGFTAGVISEEDGSNAWLLTPGTGLQVEITEDVIVRYEIHPWMKDTSDGASLRIEYNETNETLKAEQDWKNYSVPQSAHTVRIEVMSTDNDDGDWVIIRFDTAENGMT
ncbi:hypothetical protein [Aristaeella hokkaidonensis]|uniref:Uncharacterized protein n=1 Tax=Aristaeella hokkaidonensis TaxID=3046382 RepID=A0AC61MVZ7_9FIRM|nr:hypothetical protein [Aristaeella hokkaidonensis]QUC66666.1 hypothetical protein JYE49_12540 [Aristaeella hokkaidonensis]SNT94639.1 hypothetical protein SAMN06297421_10650 [Aristaeella hokkaidonensis]